MPFCQSSSATVLLHRADLSTQYQENLARFTGVLNSLYSGRPRLTVTLHWKELSHWNRQGADVTLVAANSIRREK